MLISFIAFIYGSYTSGTQLIIQICLMVNMVNIWQQMVNIWHMQLDTVLFIKLKKKKNCSVNLYFNLLGHIVYTDIVLCFYHYSLNPLAMLSFAELLG